MWALWVIGYTVYSVVMTVVSPVIQEERKRDTGGVYRSLVPSLESRVKGLEAEVNVLRRSLLRKWAGDLAALTRVFTFALASGAVLVLLFGGMHRQTTERENRYSGAAGAGEADTTEEIMEVTPLLIVVPRPEATYTQAQSVRLECQAFLVTLCENVPVADEERTWVAALNGNRDPRDQ